MQHSHSAQRIKEALRRAFALLCTLTMACQVARHTWQEHAHHILSCVEAIRALHDSPGTQRSLKSLSEEGSLTALQFDNGITGGVTSMPAFLEKFFPDVYHHTQHPGHGDSAYCKYNNQGLQLFTSCLFIAAAFSSLVGRYTTRWATLHQPLNCHTGLTCSQPNGTATKGGCSG